MVSDRRQGLWVYYRLHPELPPWAKNILRITAEGVGGEQPFANDKATIDQMPNRPGARFCNIKTASPTLLGGQEPS
jgi:ArsR family transcriptional regulator